MRNQLAALCAVVALSNASETEAAIHAFSAATRPYVNFVDLRNVTVTTDPTADSAVLYGIGVRNDYALGPHYNYAQSSWFDVPLTEVSCAWVVQSGATPGYHYSGGSHRMINNSLEVVNIGTSFTGIWIGYQARNEIPPNETAPAYARTFGQPWWIQDLLDLV